MRTKERIVRPADRVVEIRVSARHGVILSHINYSHLERVRTTRARLNYPRDDASFIDASNARSA